MNKQRRFIALVLVLAVMLWSLAACVPGPARRPNPDGANNYNPGNTTPYTAQNNNRTGTSNTNGNENQTTSMFSKLDYSFASVIPSNTNIRSGLSGDSPIIASLNSGDKVKVIGKLNGLYVVNIPNTNKLGTISPNDARLYSAMPGSTAPMPTKPIPTTTGTNTTGTGRIGAGTNGYGTTGNVGNSTTQPGTVAPGATGTTGLNQNTGTTRNTNTTANAPTATGSGTLTADASRILQLCNAERAKVGAKPLKANTDLTKLANMKSQDIVQKNYFSHQSPTYGSPFDMMKTYGISYMYAGENLAINQSADGAHQAWMNSEGHKRNILNPDFTEIGIGIYSKGNGSFAYTQMFIGR